MRGSFVQLRRGVRSAHVQEGAQHLVLRLDGLGTGNFGSLRSGALEDSNVDITAELVNMITAQRSYQANAQTIKTQDQVLSTLVNLR